jgi:hypothetical protein
MPRLYVAYRFVTKRRGILPSSLVKDDNHQKQGEIPMRKQTAFLSAAALVLCSVATASAATAMNGTDTVILSAAQRDAVWSDLSKQATNQSASGFDAMTGTFVPSSVRIEPITKQGDSAYSFAATI